jgi:hypothetical protein
MTSYKVPQGTVDAARALLAEFNHMNIDQVYSIQLRERDSNDDEAKVLHLIPIGGVLGVAILPQGQAPKDEELTFFSMEGLASCLPALGFKTVTPRAYIVSPAGAGETPVAIPLRGEAETPR